MINDIGFGEHCLGTAQGLDQRSEDSYSTRVEKIKIATSNELLS